MLIKYSYSTRKLKQEVEAIAGKPFSLLQRIKMNGNGSQRLQILEANPQIMDILSLSGTSDPYVNIELRAHGLIIHLRVRLDNWALVLPYYTLSLLAQDNKLNLYSGQWKLQLTGYRKAELRQNFLQKLLDLKGKMTFELH